MQGIASKFARAFVTLVTPFSLVALGPREASAQASRPASAESRPLLVHFEDQRIRVYQAAILALFREHHPELDVEKTGIAEVIRRGVEGGWRTQSVFLQTGARLAFGRAVRDALVVSDHDPILVYFAGIHTHCDGNLAGAKKVLRRALDGLEARNSPAWMRFLVELRLLVIATQSGDQTLRASMLARCEKSALAMALDPLFAGDQRRIYVNLVMQIYGNQVPVSAEALIRGLEELDGLPRSTLLTLRGTYWISQAWKARTSKAAKDVTEEGWRGFEENLEKAAKDLQTAHRLVPEAPEAAGAMITVCGGRGDDTSVLAKWFERATKAEFEYAQAYTSLLHFLGPKWGGSHEEMLAHAKRWAATQRYDTEVPHAYRDTLLRIAREYPKLGDLYRSPALQRTLDAIHSGYAATDAPALRRSLEFSNQVVLLALGGRAKDAAALYQSMDVGFHDGVLRQYALERPWLDGVLRPHLADHHPRKIAVGDVFADAHSVPLDRTGAGKPLPTPPRGGAATATPPSHEAWLASTLVQAYERRGTQGASWDRDAKEVLTQHAHAQEFGAAGRREHRERCQAVLDSGCTDALVRYVAARAFELTDELPLRDRVLAEAVEGLAKSEHSDLVAFLVKRMQERVHRNADRKDLADRLLTELETHAIAMASDAAFQGEGARWFLATLMPSGDYASETARIGAKLAAGLERAASVDPWLQKMVHGLHHLGLLCAPRVDLSSRDRVQEYATSAEAAQAAFTAALAARPSSPEPASASILLAALRPGPVSPRAWFDRAVAVHFDFAPAYRAFLTTLRPDWGGSLKQLYRFGSECLESGRFETRVPLVFRDAILSCESELGSSRRAWANPDVVAQYETLVAGYATHDARSALAEHLAAGRVLTAWAGGRHDVALTRFDAAAGALDPTWLRLLRTNADAVRGELEAYRKTNPR